MKRAMRTSYFDFSGGLDLVTSPLKIPPGRLLGCQNYEINIEDGYSRIDGYERYDGNSKPSNASYWVLNFDSGSSEPSIGDTIEGDTSGATGVIFYATVLSSGTFAGGDATGHFLLYEVSGTFQEDEALLISSVDIATAASPAFERGAESESLDTTYIRAAIEATRDNISVVPGSGRIRGVWIYNDAIYAFRDNAVGTAVDMYKSTSSGWSKCNLGFTLFFDAGSSAFAIDEVVEGAGGATGTIKKIVVQSGTWAGNDASGYIVLYSQSGTFVNNEALTGSISGSATANGIGSDNTFSSGGSFEFINYNFGGHSDSIKMYGVNGNDQAFEWDGSTFTFIATGMTTDTPTHVNAHQNHLFLSFTGGSIQHSSISDPTSWNVITGAAELSVGDTITGMQVTPGRVLIIFCRNSINILSGTSVADWVLTKFSPNAGAISGTIQQVQETIYLDDRGLTFLSRVDAFGDFQDNVISKLVQPRIDLLKPNVTTSVTVKNKNQYILYFDDGTAIQCTFKERQVMGFMDLDYDRPVRCIVSGEDSNGDEQIFFGSDDGYIYELNKGTSFDGSSITAFLRLAYNNLGSPQYWKRFHRISLELAQYTDPSITISFAPDFSYGDPDIPTPVATTDYEMKTGGGFWNSAIWNEFYWSGQAVGTLEGYIDGIGVNIGLLINSESTYEPTHTFNGATIHYHLRGMKR